MLLENISFSNILLKSTSYNQKNDLNHCSRITSQGSVMEIRLCNRYLFNMISLSLYFSLIFLIYFFPLSSFHLFILFPLLFPLPLLSLTHFSLYFSLLFPLSQTPHFFIIRRTAECLLWRKALDQTTLRSTNPLIN